MELRDYLQMVRRRWRLIVASVLTGVVVALLLTLAATPQYESSARLFVSTSPSDAGDAYQGGLFSAQRVTSYADLVSSRELARDVAGRLELDVPPKELATQVESTVVPDTVILELTVTDPEPENARLIAQTYAVALSAMVRDLETPPGQRNAPIKATIVDAAAVPDAPASPQPLRNLAAGLVLGLVLGIGLAIARHLLDTTITSSKDVESVTAAPVMAAIAFDPGAQRNPLVSSLELNAPRTESIRVLRTNMQFVGVDHPSKVFVVTSSLQEEGKTSTASNLAVTLAQAGRRTLLVEGDLRRPRVPGYFDLDNAVGVTSVLLGRLGWEAAIQTHLASGLDVLTSGPIPPNPAELLQSAAMRTLIADLRGAYDMVVMDAPPLLPVADATLLAAQADGVILVVRHGRTTRDQLRHAVERLEQVEVQPVGVVLNMVPARGRGAEYGYGYGHGYGSGAGEAIDESGAAASRSGLVGSRGGFLRLSRHG